MSSVEVPVVVGVVGVGRRGDHRPHLAMGRAAVPGLQAPVVLAGPAAAFFVVRVVVVVVVAAVARLSYACDFALVDWRTVCVGALWWWQASSRWYLVGGLRKGTCPSA